LNELSDPEVGRKRLSGRFGGTTFSQLPLDRPLAPEDFPEPGAVEAARSRTEVILSLVRREKPTLRQLLANLAGAPPAHFTVAGTPEQIADLIEDWFTDGAADGFNIMPPLCPHVGCLQRGSDPADLQQRGFSALPMRGDPARTLWAGMAQERLRRGDPRAGAGGPKLSTGALSEIRIYSCVIFAGVFDYLLAAPRRNNPSSTDDQRGAPECLTLSM